MFWVKPCVSTNKYGKSSPFFVFSLKWLETLPHFHSIALKILAFPLRSPRLGGSNNALCGSVSLRLCVMLFPFAELLLSILKLGVLGDLTVKNIQTKFQGKIILMARLRHIAIFRTQPNTQIYKLNSNGIFSICRIPQSPSAETPVFLGGSACE